MIIFDSSPLIHLTKIGKLDSIISLFKKLYITKAVFHEVVEEGIKNNLSDAIIIQNYVNDHKIKVIEIILPNKLKGVLHPGESESITLAITNKKNALLIMDEKKGRLIAREKNISLHGTLGILLILLKEEIIDKQKYRTNLRRYADNGWLSLYLYELFRQEAETNE